MAISHQHDQLPSSLLDTLYCEEEQWVVDDENENKNENDEIVNKNNNISASSFLPIMLLDEYMLWEDEELVCLFSKEERQRGCSKLGNFDHPTLEARRESVEWMLMVNTHFGFSTLTAVLAVNYLDRFLSSVTFPKDKPWTMHLTAVTCLSLAAKVEETFVPFLLDLQVEETIFVFEAKTIQKMELLVLSTLEWKMNPVTPLSFLDHIIRRLGLKNHLHWEFLHRCESLLLSVLPDCRFVSYLPSVLATATMMYVIDQIESCNSFEYQNQLFGVLNISKEKMNDCYQLIVELSSSRSSNSNANYPIPTPKRKLEQMMSGNDNMKSASNSPSRVMDYLSCDSSKDSWSSSTSPATNTKKGRVVEHEQPVLLPTPLPLSLLSLSRVFVDVVGNGNATVD